MLTEQLVQAGLSEKEAQAYEKLLELGPSSVGKLIKSTPFKRGDLYNILYSLRDKGLLSEELKKGVMTFTLENPEKLKDLVASEKEKLKQKEKLITDAVPQLKSLYNLSMNKPGVRFYEGREGVWTVLEDTLTSKTEILMYGDHDAIIRFIPDINQRYIKARGRLGIKKRMVMFETASAPKHLQELTETKFMPRGSSEFLASITNIYDDKIAYLTFTETSSIGVIVEDASICQLNRAIFEHVWKSLPEGFL